MKIRRLSQDDLLDVSRIQRECYSEDILESVDSFSAKLNADPGFSFIAVHNEMAVGYVVALPWVFGEILELNSLEYSVPPNADSLCIHDLAVSPKVRNAGTARQLLNAVFEAAELKGYKRVFLIALAGASSYWKRHGFEIVPVTGPLMHRLAAYGEGAAYMVKLFKEV